MTFVEYLFFHPDERCQYHDDYYRMIKEAKERSLGWLGLLSDDIPDKDSGPNCHKRKSNNKQDRLLHQDTNVMIDVSDGDDDVNVVNISTKNQHVSPDKAGRHRPEKVASGGAILGKFWDKGKSVVNPPVTHTQRLKATGSNNMRPPSSLVCL